MGRVVERVYIFIFTRVYKEKKFYECFIFRKDLTYGWVFYIYRRVFLGNLFYRYECGKNEKDYERDECSKGFIWNLDFYVYFRIYVGDKVL